MGRQRADAEAAAGREDWHAGPSATDAAQGGLLALSDDELLYRIQALPASHALDSELMAVVRSARHFFVRQEAAKRIRDPGLLKDLAHDRHIGQILVRGLNRAEDVAYLEKLVAETRHLEVRKAAELQLRLIARERSGAKR